MHEKSLNHPVVRVTILKKTAGIASQWKTFDMVNSCFGASRPLVKSV